MTWLDDIGTDVADILAEQGEALTRVKTDDTEVPVTGVFMEDAATPVYFADAHDQSRTATVLVNPADWPDPTDQESLKRDSEPTIVWAVKTVGERDFMIELSVEAIDRRWSGDGRRIER